MFRLVTARAVKYQDRASRPRANEKADENKEFEVVVKKHGATVNVASKRREQER